MSAPAIIVKSNHTKESLTECSKVKEVGRGKAAHNDSINTHKISSGMFNHCKEKSINLLREALKKRTNLGFLLNLRGAGVGRGRASKCPTPLSGF